MLIFDWSVKGREQWSAVGYWSHTVVSECPGGQLGGTCVLNPISHNLDRIFLETGWTFCRREKVSRRSPPALTALTTPMFHSTGESHSPHKPWAQFGVLLGIQAVIQPQMRGRSHALSTTSTLPVSRTAAAQYHLETRATLKCHTSGVHPPLRASSYCTSPALGLHFHDARPT